MTNKRSLWVTLCLINLLIVALLGFVLRSKILFSLPFINYRNFLSAHSHFAFSGWIGLSLITLLIYDVLPLNKASKKIYQYILIAFEISSLGMAFTFPFEGYAFLSIFFSSAYIFTYFLFAFIFLKDLLSSSLDKAVKLLGASAIASLVISSVGPLGLVYILISNYANAMLYRDSIYTFLHFQYNGFFTLSVFALFFNLVIKKISAINKSAYRFAFFLCLSVVPTLFLALLWHNNKLFYVIAAIGCVLLLIALFYFLQILTGINKKMLFSSKLAYTLCLFSFLAFIIKLCLQAGTIIPSLSNAVYGDRPVIIGFLHLVFLGFVTFYMLSNYIESGYFKRNNNKNAVFPFYIFSFAIIYNEAVLMVQGLGILFKTNSAVFNVLLWIASILLFAGAASILIARMVIGRKKKGMEQLLPMPGE